MNEAGIDHAVVAPSTEHVTVRNEEGNSLMAALIATYPKKLSGLAVANPWYGKKAVCLLKTYFEQGLVGLYLNPERQGFHITEALIDLLMEVCITYHKPVYCHTGTPVCAMPFQLAELARRFPSVSFVMGHAGWSDFSGYDVIPAAQQAPNILIETSCTTGSLVRDLIETLGPDRVLFGSGYPQSRPKLEIGKIKYLKLRPAILRKLMCDNARKLWGINI